MDGSGHLLVEQDVAGGAIDPRIGADPYFAEQRGARIGLQRGLEVLLAALGARVDHLAVAEAELDAGDRDPARPGGNREADPPVRGALERAGEDLAAGHVALAVGVDPRAALNLERQVGAVGLDSDLARRRQPLHELRLRVVQIAPGRGRVRPVQEQRPGDELGVLLDAHARLLGERGRRHQCPTPPLRQLDLGKRLASGGRTGDHTRIDAGELVGVGGRIDPDQRIERPDQSELDRGWSLEVAFAGVTEEAARLRRRREHHERPRITVEDRLLERQRERLGERGRPDQHLRAGRHFQAPVADQLGERGRVGSAGCRVHGTSSSGKWSSTCARSESRTNARSEADAIR